MPLSVRSAPPAGGYEVPGLEALAVEDQPLGRSSSPQVLETRSFHLTVSTLEPVSQECQDAIRGYIMSHCCYYYIVTETGKSGKLHLHAIMIFDSGKIGKKLQENITNRMVRPMGHPTAKNGRAVMVQVCPGHKWYDEYLKKEPGRRVLADKYDRDAVTEYFPTEAVQEFLQARSRAGGPADKHMAEHKRRWIEHSIDGSYESAVKYLKHRMYVLEDMIIIQDKRRLTQLAFALYEYRNQITEVNSMESAHYTTMMSRFDFSPP